MKQQERARAKKNYHTKVAFENLLNIPLATAVNILFSRPNCRGIDVHKQCSGDRRLTIGRDEIETTANQFLG